MKKVCSILIAFVLIASFCSCDVSTNVKIKGSDELISFVEKLENGKISEAYTLYINLYPEETTKANTLLRQHLETIEEKYNNGTYDFSTSKILLEGYTSFDVVKDSATEILERISVSNNDQISLAKAENHFSNGKYDQAIIALKTIAASSKYYEQAIEMLGNCISSYRDSATVLAEEAIAAKDYTVAFATINNALELLPNDTALMLYYDQITDSYENYLLIEAEELFNKNPIDAISLLKNAIVETDAIQRKIQSMTDSYGESIIQRALAEAKVLAQNKDYTNAINVLQNADVSWLNTTELSDKVTEYLNERSVYLETLALSEAKAFADQKDWKNAVSRLEKELNNTMIYSKTNINSKIEEYSTKLPKRLTELNCIQSEAEKQAEYHDDIFGNYYDDVIEFRLTYHDKSSQYILNRNYNTFETTVFSNNEDNVESYYTIKIYGDDSLLVAHSNVACSDEPIHITADVTGCLKLKIEILVNDGRPWFYVGIGNPIVSNK